MVDPRTGVARETVDAWLNTTFAVPLSLRSDMMEAQRAQRGEDIHDAILDSLPRDRGRSDLLELCGAVRKRLVRSSKAATWPTAAEVADAFRAELNEGRPDEGSAGWPHKNSEYVIESTIRWLERFKTWPNYLAFPEQVAAEVMARTNYSKADLIRMGMRATYAEARAAGIEWGTAPEMPSLQRVPGGFD